MAYFKNSDVYIAGISGAVPKNKVAIEDYSEQFGKEDVGRFMNNTGIKFVHRTSEHQTASDLGYAAAENLINKLELSREKIGILIFVSQSPDYRKPATACVLQKRLRLPVTCAAFDVNLGCSAFVYGNQIMRSILKDSDVDFGLLIIGETSSKLVSPDDESTAMMFGDAGTAIAYKRSENEDISSTVLLSDGNRYKSIIVPAGGFRDMEPKEEFYIASDGRRHSKYCSYMDGVGVFTFAVTDVVSTISEYLNKHSKKITDYDFVVLHQANNLIIKRIAHKLGIPSDLLLNSLDTYGNTSGVSIPLTISENYGNVNVGIKKGIVVGYGIGLSWGITEITVNTDNVLPIIETDDFYDEGIIK